MPGKNVKFPGGTTEQENSVIGFERQVRVDEERHSLRLHDGVKQGGWEIPSLEQIETLLTDGGLNQTGDSISVVKIFNTVNELKAQTPNLSLLAVVREDNYEDLMLWAPGAATPGDVASDISGRWVGIDSPGRLAISLWRSGLINLQINGTEPAANQGITAWLTNGVLRLWDSSAYIAASPTTFARLLATIGGYATGSYTLPDRIIAQSFEIANMNTVVESGWYKTAVAATGAPVAGVHSFEHRELTNAIAIQILHTHNSPTRNYWVRYRTAVTPTWTSWIEIAGDLPDRLKATSPVGTDPNALLESGFYFVSGATNGPAASSGGYMLHVMRESAANITQLAIMLAGTIARRTRVANVWGAWVDVSLFGHLHDDRYYTESEMTTLLAGKAASVHTHDDRYYTEAEMNSLLAGKATVSVDSVVQIGQIAWLCTNTNVAAGNNVSGANLLLTAITTQGNVAGSIFNQGFIGYGTWRNINPFQVDATGIANFKRIA